MSARSIDRPTLILLSDSRDFLAERCDTRISLEEAARAAYLSPYHYHRLFTRAYGETPHAFLTRLRMIRARQLLIAGELSVTEVCLAVGYASPGTFSTRFLRETGCSPSEYRRRANRFFRISALDRHRFIPTCFLTALGALDR
jgi:AraC-like DNA-binding protein